MRGESHDRSWRAIIRWPVFLLANLALLLVVGISTVRETYRGWTVDREIKELQAQAAALEGSKLEFETLTKSLASPERVDYDARAKLGRKKPGERVIIIEGFAATATWQDELQLALQEDALPKDPKAALASNPARWWWYFMERRR